MRKSIVAVTAFFVLASNVGAQDSSNKPAWKQFTERRPYIGVGAMLNKDAAASDPDGIHYYAEDLAHLLLPDQAGDKYVNSFADRLAKAEQEVRAGKRGLIPDTQVVAAYSELARRRNPATKPANLDALRRYRTDSYPANAWPAVITADQNGTYCNPGEVIFLITVLWHADGDLTPPPAPAQPIPTPTSTVGPTTTVENRWGFIPGAQSQQQIVKEFDAVAKSLGICIFTLERAKGHRHAYAAHVRFCLLFCRIPSNMSS